ncbi:LysR family transcriptional regulator [Onishia taeanensis]
MYDFDELAAFATVMEEGSLARSAMRLGVSKSTLSRRIHQLESHLGQPLLRRQSNRMIATEAGEIFLRYCHQLQQLARQSHQALDELTEAVSGALTVHVHSVFLRGWFASCAEDFLARYPGVRLEVRTQFSVPTVGDDRALCLWLGRAPECGLRQETLGRLSRRLYAHPDYLARYGVPCHPRELAGHDWVDLLGDAEEGLDLHHEREGIIDVAPPPSRLRVDQYAMHLDAIARGRGLGVLPDWMVAQREKAHPGELVPCLEAWRPADLPVTLLYPFGQRPRRVTSLLEMLRQSVPPAWQRDR